MKEYLKKYKGQFTAALIALVVGAGGGIAGEALMDQGQEFTTPHGSAFAWDVQETIESPTELPGKAKGYIYQIELIWKAEQTAIPGLDRHYDSRRVKVIGEVPEKNLADKLKPIFPGYKAEKVLRIKKIATILKDRADPG